MDNTLKAAYAALEKWKKTVTVKKFVEDNKRLNCSKNPNSPTLSTFLQSSTMRTVTVSKNTVITSENYLENYIRLLSITHRNQLDYFLKREEIIQQIAMLERNFYYQKALSVNTPDSVVSIVVRRRNTQTSLTRNSVIVEQEKIKSLLSFEDRSHSRSEDSNQILRYASPQLCSA